MPRGSRAGGGGMRSGGGFRGGGSRGGGFRSGGSRGFRASPSFSRRGARRTIHHRPTGFHRRNRYGGWGRSPWHRRRYSYWGYRSTTGGSIIAIIIIMFFVVPIFFGIFFAAFSGGFTVTTGSYDSYDDYGIYENVNSGYFTYWSVFAAEGANLHWEFDSLANVPIEFYLIKGYSDFSNFENDYTFWAEDTCDGCAAGSGSYYVSSSDEYFFVFWNSDIYYDTTVDATIDVVQSTTYEGTSESGPGLGFSGIMIIVIVGFIIIGGIAVVIKFSRTSDRTGNYLQSTTGSPGPSSGSPPVSPATGAGRQLTARSAPVSSPAPVSAVPRTIGGKFCTKCGSSIKPGDTFCVSCGIKVSSASPVATRTATKAAGDGKCAYCGALLTAGDSCTSCGQRREKCEVCRRQIQFGDEIGRCMHCQRVFHYSHLRETVKVTGKCPVCREPLKESDIKLETIGRHK